MLHTPKKKTSKKPLIVVISTLLVIIIGWLLYTYHYQTWPFTTNKSQTSPTNSKIDYSPPSGDQTKTGADVKSQIANSDKDSASSSQSSPTSQPSTLGVSITTVQPGQTVRIRTIIDTVTSSGKCKLNMSGPNGKTYTATAATQAMASSSTCQGFDIPMTSLSSGDWQISITVTDGSSTGSATTEKTL